MGLPRLYWLCLAFLPLSALAADPPVNRSGVSTTVNPATGYHVVNTQTIRTPPNVTISPVRDITPHVSSYGGGLQQTIPSGITINGVKESGTLGARVRATTQTLKGGAKTLLKGNLATVVLTAGLQQLLSGVGAIIDDGGKVSMINETGTPSISGGFVWTGGTGAIVYPTVQAACSASATCTSGGACAVGPNTNPATGAIAQCYTQSGLTGNSIYASAPVCPEGAILTELGCTLRTPVPLSPQDIDNAVDNSYIPDPSDWTLLVPHFSLDDVEITSPPTLQSEPKTTTVYDANGNPHTVKETNIWHDFDIRDNRTPEPKLDHKQRTEEKTFEDGLLTGSTETTSTTPAPATGGGGSSQPPIELDIPTDCDFMPTVCAFIDWFKNDDLPEEPDLRQLIDDREFEETYTITGGSKQCPADYEFTLSFIGQSYALSFEPACDFASKIYFFVMAGAYIMAAYITIGAARNG